MSYPSSQDKKKMQEIKSEAATRDANDVSDLRGCRSPYTMGLCCKSIYLCDYPCLKTKVVAVSLH